MPAGLVCGVPEHVNLTESECGDERDRVPRRLLDRVRGRAGRAADASVVIGDHPAGRRQRVDQRRIPGVEVAAEVLEQQERDRSVVTAGVPVRIVDAVRGAD
jgi:hypothetical protein